MKYASVIVRALAQVLDYIILSLFFFPVTYLVKGKWLMFPEDHLWIIFDPLCAVFLLIIFLYFIVLEKLTGQTVGKYIFRIKVSSIDGGIINCRQSIIRNLGRMLDGLPIINLLGIISILNSPLKQRIGDKLAKTIVHQIVKQLI